VDEAGFGEEVEHLMPTVRTDVRRMRSGYEKLRPFLDEVHRRAWARPLPIDRFVGSRSLK
jgi:hypothetical protein